MGNDITQYRIAIGVFYGCRYKLRYCRCYKNSLTYCDIFNLLCGEFRELCGIFSIRCKTFLACVLLCFIQASLYNMNVTLVLLLLLQLAGDVESNPGPNNNDVTSNCKSLSIFHLNTRSVRHKLDFLSEFLSEYLIVCFTETHLDDNICNENIKWPTFHDPIRKDRNAFGGGIMIYVSKCLSFKRRYDLENPIHEAVWIEVYLPQKSIILCTAYRPENIHTIDFWNYLNYSIENAFDISNKLVIVGDLNVNLLSNKRSHLSDIIDAKHLRNTVIEPTRITNTTRTLLDPILISDDIHAMESGVTEFEHTVSDHKGTYIDIRIHELRDMCYTREVWCYNKGDYARLNRLIDDIDWKVILNNCSTTDEACDTFYKMFLHLTNECIPRKKVTIRPNDKPWFNSDLRRETRRRDRLRKLARNSKKEKYIIAYRKQRNKVNNMKYHAKEVFYSNLEEVISGSFADNKTNYWKILRYLIRQCGSTNCIPPLRKLDTDIKPTMFSDVQKAEAMNDYFASISNTLDINGPPTYIAKRCQSTLGNIHVHIQEVRDIIKSLAINKASGPDKISHKLLKLTSDSICKPLCILFNISISNNHFPSNWKLAHVMPIYKKGEKSVMSNYRPISLISCVGKLFERVVYKHLSNYFLSNRLLYKYQSGFQAGHSTVHQLVEMYDDVCTALDKREDYCMIFCDISKAFDRVWHAGLLLKLQSYGVTGQLLKWLESYISNRKQSVFVNGVLSNPRCLNAGVPQGSVLGPFLFIVYINDIADNLNCITRLFADDTSIGVSSADINIIESKLNKNMEQVCKWSKEWLIKFNPDKTETILFSLKRNDTQLKLMYEDIEIKNVSTHKHLGVIFSSDGKWSYHIDSIIKTTSKMICSMRKLKYMLNRNTLSTIYVMYIRPHFEYACEVWDGCPNELCEKLEKLQLEAARIVTGLPTYCSRCYLYYETGWEKLAERRKNRKLSLFYKINSGQVPLYLSKKLPSSDQSRYNLRYSQNVNIPFKRTTLAYQSYFPSTARLWNSIPIDTRSASTVCSFKSKIRQKHKHLPMYFSHGIRKFNVIHTKLRYSVTQLNYDLSKYGLINNMSCSCGYICENNHHYLMSCPLYNHQRHVLLESINLIVNCKVEIDLALLLNGNEKLTNVVNKQIFTAVQLYIKKTNRFT